MTEVIAIEDTHLGERGMGREGCVERVVYYGVGGLTAMVGMVVWDRSKMGV